MNSTLINPTATLEPPSSATSLGWVVDNASILFPPLDTGVAIIVKVAPLLPPTAFTGVRLRIKRDLRMNDCHAVCVYIYI